MKSKIKPRRIGSTGWLVFLAGCVFVFTAGPVSAQVMSLAPPSKQRRAASSVDSPAGADKVQFRQRSTGTRPGAVGRSGNADAPGVRGIAPPTRTLSRFGGKHFVRMSSATGQPATRGTQNRTGSALRMNRVGPGSARVD